MSLFGSMMGDFDDDMFMNNPMNMMQMQMRNMNRMMNSLMPDPFNMLMPFDNGRQQNNMLMDRNNGPLGMNGFFGFPMANMNRLLNADGIAANGGTSYCSSSVISMSSGPDGRPQIYQATTSSKTGPGGIRETRKTVQDSMNGVKKMAIGHHIGERAHIIEKEEDLRSGQLEERQEFINLDEEEAELFDREFINKANKGSRHVVSGGPHRREVLTIQDVDDDDDDEEEINPHHRRPMLALPPAPSSQSKRSIDTETAATSQNTSTSQQRHVRELSMSSNNNYFNNNNYNNGNHISNIRNAANQNHFSRRSHALGAMPRRSLRSLPASSPLVISANLHHQQLHNHLHNVGVTSPSVLHPHPYKNAMPSRRQRAKQQLQEEHKIQKEIEEQQKQNLHDIEENEVVDADDDDDDDEPQVIIEEPDDDEDDDNAKDDDQASAK